MKTNKSLKILRIIFILCGGKLFLDWILPTNPSSKNPLWKRLWALANDEVLMSSPAQRLNLAFGYGCFHFICFFIYFFLSYDWWTNILVNVYPIIVQIYIGLRCWLIIKQRRKLKVIQTYAKA